MLYQKNLPMKERVIRVVAAVAMVACGLIGLQGMAIGYLVAGAGVITALNGFLGFCPACSMAGRSLPRSE
jgi:Protein of unknown function (DUF2892)